ncbi:MAG: hypothetical protein Q9164_002968 [Protoblastenia rupestris]
MDGPLTEEYKLENTEADQALFDIESDDDSDGEYAPRGNREDHKMVAFHPAKRRRLQPPHPASHQMFSQASTASVPDRSTSIQPASQSQQHSSPSESPFHSGNATVSDIETWGLDGKFFEMKIRGVLHVRVKGGAEPSYILKVIRTIPHPDISAPCSSCFCIWVGRSAASEQRRKVHA